MQGKMNVELLVSLVSEHKELYDKRDSDYKNLDKRELVFLVFLFYIKRHLMSGNEFACSLGSSSAKIAWVWTQKTRWKTLANNARRYSSRCVRPFRLKGGFIQVKLVAFVAYGWMPHSWNPLFQYQLVLTIVLKNAAKVGMVTWSKICIGNFFALM